MDVQGQVYVNGELNKGLELLNIAFFISKCESYDFCRPMTTYLRTKIRQTAI